MSIASSNIFPKCASTFSAINTKNLNGFILFFFFAHATAAFELLWHTISSRRAYKCQKHSEKANKPKWATNEFFPCLIKYTYAFSGWISVCVCVFESACERANERQREQVCMFVGSIKEHTASKFPKRDLIGYCEGKTLVSHMKQVFVFQVSLDPNIHVLFYYGCWMFIAAF